MIYPWQRRQWQQLHAMRRASRLPHGLLFCGPRGTGKGAFARAFAQSLLCAALLADDEACGECGPCRLASAGNHPDLRQIVPEEEGKVIKIDQVRELADFANLKSHGGGSRIAVLDPADAMNRNAANSLLKTLEEPPPGTILMLVSHQPALLPVTVRSRCQQIRFTAGGDAALSWLDGQVAEGIDAQTALRVAQGGPLAALTMIADGSFSSRADQVELLEQLRARKVDPVSIAAKWAQQGGAPVFASLGALIQDLIKIKTAGGSDALANLDLQNCLNELAKGLDLDELFKAYDRIVAAGLMLGRGSNVREQDVLEDFAIAWVDGLQS